MVAQVPQAHLDRVGRIVGKVFSAGLDEKDVFPKFTSKTTWQTIKRGLAPDRTTDDVLLKVETYLDGILEERRKGEK